MARKTLYGSLIIMMLAFFVHQAVSFYMKRHGIDFQLYDPPEYKSFVNLQFSHAKSPWDSVESKINIAVLVTFLFALCSYLTLRERNKKDRICIVFAVIILISNAMLGASGLENERNKMVEQQMDRISLGMSDPEDSFGGRWTGVFLLDSPEFDKVIVHNHPTFLRAVIGLKQGKVVSSFLYAEKLSRYKICNINLLIDRYKNQTLMWKDLVERVPENDVKRLALLERSLYDNLDKIKSVAPLWIFHDVWEQFYDDSIETLKFIYPQTHFPSRLELARKAMEKSWPKDVH